MSDILYRVQTHEDPLDIEGVLFVTRSRKPNKGDYDSWAQKLVVTWGTTIHAIYEDVKRNAPLPMSVVPVWEGSAYLEKRQAYMAANETAYDIEGSLYDVTRGQDELLSAMQNTASDYERISTNLRKNAAGFENEATLYLYEADRWSEYFYNSYVGRFLEEATWGRGMQNIKNVAVAGAALDRALIRARRVVPARLAVLAPGYTCCEKGTENPLYKAVPAEDRWQPAAIVCVHCGTELPPLPRYELPEIPAPKEVLT